MKRVPAVLRALGPMPVTALVNVLITLIGLITGTLLARLLGPQGRGELAAIQAWPTYLVGFAMVGLPHALTYYCGRNPQQSGALLATAVTIGLAACVPVLALGYWLMPTLLSAQSPELIFIARWYLLLLPVQVVCSLPYAVLQGRLQLRAWNMLRLLAPAGWLLLILALVIFGQPSPGRLAIGFLVVLLAGAVPVFRALRHTPGGPFLPHRDFGVPLLRYGFASVLSGLPQDLNLRMDQLLMAAWLPASVLGPYAVAVTWSNGLAPVFNAVEALVLPRLAGTADLEKQRTDLLRNARMGALVFLALTLPWLLLTPAAIALLFGAPYRAVIPAALVLVVAGGIAGVNRIFEQGLRGLGLPGLVTFAELAGLAVTVTLLPFVLVPLQAVGAALVSLISYAVTLVVLTSLIMRHLHCSAAELFVPVGSELLTVVARARAALQAAGS